MFVDASVDPETLTHSRAALAQALVEQGPVAEAVRGGGDGLPLLRGSESGGCLTASAIHIPPDRGKTTRRPR